MIRYSIRDLLWLTVVAAFAVLWWGETRQRKSESAELWAKHVGMVNDHTAALSELDIYRKQQSLRSPQDNSRVAVSAVRHVRKRHARHSCGAQESLHRQDTADVGADAGG
jgi:hypothetical protein